jgi:hypothetical protein
LSEIAQGRPPDRPSEILPHSENDSGRYPEAALNFEPAENAERSAIHTERSRINISRTGQGDNRWLSNIRNR